MKKPSRKRKETDAKRNEVLYLRKDLWKAARIRAIEMDVDAMNPVVEATQQFLEKGSRS
jgi:hypothetical protein